MPLATIASAVSLISWALTSQPKWFQLFQPVGGVRARPLSSGCPGDAPPRTTAMPRLMSIAERADMPAYVMAVRRSWLAPLVLLVADLLHPVHGLVVELLVNGDVGHRGRRRCAVPMLFTRRDPDHVTRPDLLDRPAPPLRTTHTERHDQGLTEGMGVPCSARPRLERDTGTRDACRIGCLVERIDPHGAGEPIGRPFAGRLRASSLDLHSFFSFTVAGPSTPPRTVAPGRSARRSSLTAFSRRIPFEVPFDGFSRRTRVYTIAACHPGTQRLATQALGALGGADGGRLQGWHRPRARYVPAAVRHHGEAWATSPAG